MDGCVKCPKCNYEYVYFYKIVTDLIANGNDDAIRSICMKGTVSSNFLLGKNLESGRDNIYIYFKCEQGCMFIMHYQNYKGQAVYQFDKSMPG